MVDETHRNPPRNDYGLTIIKVNSRSETVIYNYIIGLCKNGRNFTALHKIFDVSVYYTDNL
jgi:hypothetical protein